MQVCRCPANRFHLTTISLASKPRRCGAMGDSFYIYLLGSQLAGSAHSNQAMPIR